MTIQEFGKILRERWRIVATAVVIGIAGALAFFLVRPITYTADVSLYVSAQTNSDPQSAYQGAQLSEQRVKSYTQLVTGDRVLGQVNQNLGLNSTPAELASRISATSALDSVIIVITGTDRSPTGAANIANSAATVTASVVDELERPTAPNGVAPVAVRIVQPALPPVGPSSIGLTALLPIGALLGLVLGVTAALVRQRLDNSVKNADALAAMSKAPTIGRIPFDASYAEQPLSLRDAPQSGRAEAYRQMRINLQFLDVDKRQQVIAVTSSMPDEGKTTTVANLALSLAAVGHRVLMVEADLRRPKLSNLVGADRSVGLTNILTGSGTLQSVAQICAGGALEILASGRTPPNPSELLGSHQMRAILDEARSIYDFVLVDTPPVLPVSDTPAIAPAVDAVILVSRYNWTSTGQLTAAVAALGAVAAAPAGAVLSMVPTAGPNSMKGYGSYYTAESAKAPVGLGSEDTVATSGPVRPAPQAHRPRPEVRPAGTMTPQRNETRDRRI